MMKLLVRLMLFISILFTICNIGVSRGISSLNTQGVGALEKLYQQEWSIKAQYSAYAKKADAEGFLQAGSLFRAVLKAEEIHLTNLAEEIKQKDGNPQDPVIKLQVKSTQENLDELVKQESKNQSDILSGSLKKARGAGDMDSVRVLNDICQGKAMVLGYLKLLQKELPAGKKGKKGYVFCPLCGYLIEDSNPLRRCPLCPIKRESFIRVN